VTLVALPLAQAGDPDKGWELFEKIEDRFARQVRVSIPLAGLTGLWMTWRLDLWARFVEPLFWWMDAMLALWALFMGIVFIIEPLARQNVATLAARDPAALLRRLQRAHFFLLAAGIVTILSAVAGARGGQPAPPYYRITEVYFENLETMQKTLASPEWGVIVKDVANFADPGTLTGFASQIGA
jgi:uncharacterized protein (TIGR02118 family)